MDSFQELFSGGDSGWATGGEGSREVLRGRDNVSSADSTTPPPQNIDDREERKSANSIRGKDNKPHF